VRIRRADAADIEAILRIERAAASAPHWNLAVYANAIAGKKNRCVFVADEDGICGFAVASLVANEAELESVAVVASWAMDAGATAVSLEVRAASAAAIGLYRWLGFERVGLRKAYYAEPTDDAALMRLALENTKAKD